MIYLNISKNFLWGYVNMLSLTFYKGVPFDREQQNVLFVDNEKRNEFLSNYIVPIQTLEIKQFALLGSTNNPFLVVSLDKEPFNVNYLKVIQTIEKTGEERMLFYYIDNYEMVTPENVRLNLTMDFFQTYFNKYDMQENRMERPEIKNALVMQGHGFENGGETEEVIQPDKVLEYYQCEQIMESSAFRVVLHMISEMEPYEFCIISQQTFGMTNAQEQLNKYFGRATGVIRTTINSQMSQREINFKILNAYLVPVDFFPTYLTDYATFYFSEDTTYNDFFYMSIMLNDGTSQFISRVLTYDVTPNEAEFTTIGTGQTNFDLKFNGKTYEITIRLVIANDIEISCYVNRESKSLTEDFAMSVVVDEYAQYMSTTKNSRHWNTITKATMSGIGIATGIGKIATGDIASGGALIASGVAGGALSYANEQARLNDMDSKPATLTNDTGSLISLRYFMGFSVCRMKPANQDDIKTYNNYFGFKMNGFNSTLDISAQNENQKFRYCQCGYLSLIGNFDYEIKERLESYFKRGIRIWYDKDNYLNGFEP